MSPQRIRAAFPVDPPIVLAAALVLFAAAASAQGTTTEVAVGCDETGLLCNEVFGRFELAGGISGSLTLRFEEALGLRDGGLDVAVELIDPQDPEIADRLPGDAFIPGDFPVLLTIQRGADSHLRYRGGWTLELISDNLEYSSHTPLRLFRAPPGGAFEDISLGLGSGSFRVRAGGNAFSEFVIAADLRPLDRVIEAKLDRLDSLLEQVAELIGDLHDDLVAAVAAIRQAALVDGDLSQALAALAALRDLVLANAGGSIPDFENPDTGAVGVAAQLAAAVRSLGHSLGVRRESDRRGSTPVVTQIDLPDRGQVELKLEFEEKFVIDPEDLDIGAELIDPGDPELLDRLPEGVQVPEEFPVLIRVRPRSGVSQAFSGLYGIELRTDRLAFVGDSPLRLFKAPDGGAFSDITGTYGLGTFRVRGGGNAFSEFVIAEDLRTVEEVVAAKLDSLEAALQAASSELPRPVRRSLAGLIEGIRDDVEAGKLDEAAAGIEALILEVRRRSGDEIPAVWIAGSAKVNVAGQLRAIAETLRFSLELKAAPLVADPYDVNRDGKVDFGDVFLLLNRVLESPQ